MSNKTVLISGASSGIGRSTAHKFSEHGYHIIGLGRNQDALNLMSEECLSRGASGVKTYQIELSKPNAVADLFKQHAADFSVIDCLVNSAGISFVQSIDSISDETWEKTFRVNVTAAFALIRESLPYLKKSAAPSVVNVSSIAGRLRSISLGADYSTSKCALIGLTRHLAAELGPNIRVNCSCPSQTHTPLLENALSKEGQKALAETKPLKRLASAEEQANVIYFLGSSDSSYMTGAIVDVNGGTL